MSNPKLDVVIPIFNEREIIEQLHRRVFNACRRTNLDFCITYIDDGSTDGTSKWIEEQAGQPISIEKYHCSTTDSPKSPCNETHLTSPATAMRRMASVKTAFIKLIQLSRNYGQPAAILAGLKSCTGDVVVLMDGDLQDPPEMIPDLVERWQKGDEIVIAQRTTRKETFLRGLAFKGFHRVFRYLSDANIPTNTGTFCLLSRQAVAAVCELPESHRFFPGLRAWVGFRQSLLTFERPPRAGGEPKQTFSRLFRYAMDAIFGYSLKPLRLLTGTGVLICFTAFALASWFICKRLVGWESASIGFTTLTCAVFCLGGFQLIGMGILGEYIGRIYDETKRRPPFIVAREVRLDLNETLVQTSNWRVVGRKAS